MAGFLLTNSFVILSILLMTECSSLGGRVVVKQGDVGETFDYDPENSAVILDGDSDDQQPPDYDYKDVEHWFEGPEVDFYREDVHEENVEQRLGQNYEPVIQYAGYQAPSGIEEDFDTY